MFLTIVTYQRASIFRLEENVAFLHDSIPQVMTDLPFEIPAAVILPDHLQFLWTMASGDSDYSRRIGRMKVLFTRSLLNTRHPQSAVSESRRRHREADVWQRRFWEHTIGDEYDFEQHLNYIHYNPVKHSQVTCPHLWPYSSFDRWARSGLYDERWGCCCDGRIPVLPKMIEPKIGAGE